MNEFFQSLNNREISLFVWIILFFTWASFNKGVRSTFVKLIKHFLKRPILLIHSFIIPYISIIIYFLFVCDFWNFSMLKDSIIWVLGTGFITLIYVNKFSNDENNFKKYIFDTIKLIVVFEFIFNLYSFSLPVELILIPSLAILGGIEAIASLYPKYKILLKPIKFILTVLTLTIIVFTFYKIFNDLDNFLSFANLKLLLLPIILSISLIPYLYVIALYLSYEMFFLKIESIFRNEKDFIKPVKKTMLILCKLNLFKLNRTRRIRNDEFYHIIKRNIINSPSA